MALAAAKSPSVSRSDRCVFSASRAFSSRSRKRSLGSSVSSSSRSRRAKASLIRPSCSLSSASPRSQWSYFESKVENACERSNAAMAVVLPTHAEVITQQMAALLENRGIISWLMVVVLLFFSSLAFTVVENAMSFIFFHRVQIHRRHFLVSAILPYAYILVLGLGFLLMSLIAGALYAIEGTQINLLGVEFTLEGISRFMLYVIGLAGQILILTSFYLVMPLGKLSFRHALIGGVTAGLLWEVVRHVLVWYFSTLSVVSLVYGSLATTIVFLLSLEIAGLILLFGAQVIAEYERFTLESRPEAGGIQN